MPGASPAPRPELGRGVKTLLQVRARLVTLGDQKRAAGGEEQQRGLEPVAAGQEGVPEAVQLESPPPPVAPTRRDGRRSGSSPPSPFAPSAAAAEQPRTTAGAAPPPALRSRSPSGHRRSLPRRARPRPGRAFSLATAESWRRRPPGSYGEATQPLPASPTSPPPLGPLPGLASGTSAVRRGHQWRPRASALGRWRFSRPCRRCCPPHAPCPRQPRPPR